MVSLVDMPRSWAHFWDLRKVYSTCIVFEEFAENSGCRLGNGYSVPFHFVEQVHHDDGNLQQFTEAHILRLRAGKHNFSL
jgi:hypothetical protein